MNLYFNAPREQVKYKEFSGRIVEQMPLLVQERRLPLSIPDVMRRRIQVLDKGFSDDIRHSWLQLYFDTGDAIAYNTQGDLKFVPNSKSLLELTRKSKLKDGALIIDDEVYQKLPGTLVKKDELTRMRSHRSIKDHPFWLMLAQDDRSLLDSYGQMVESFRRKHGFKDTFGIALDTPSDVLKLRACGLFPVSEGYSVISSGYNSGLLNDLGRLIGSNEIDEGE